MTSVQPWHDPLPWTTTQSPTLHKLSSSRTLTPGRSSSLTDGLEFGWARDRVGGAWKRSKVTSRRDTTTPTFTMSTGLASTPLLQKALPKPIADIEAGIDILMDSTGHAHKHNLGQTPTVY